MGPQLAMSARQQSLTFTPTCLARRAWPSRFPSSLPPDAPLNQTQISARLTLPSTGPVLPRLPMASSSPRRNPVGDGTECVQEGLDLRRLYRCHHTIGRYHDRGSVRSGGHHLPAGTGLLWGCIMHVAKL